MKILVVLLAALAVAGTAHAASWDPPVVYVADRATTITPEQVAAALPALQDAVQEDFAPAWGVGSRTRLVLTDTPPASGPVLVLRDESRYSFVLGMHDHYRRAAWAQIFTAHSDVPWTIVFSHELFEMLADPWLGRLAYRWIVEVSDPVLQRTYVREGVQVADFVYPSWYRPHGSWPYDLLGAARRPHQILDAGYASWLDAWGSWHVECSFGPCG